MPEVIEKKRGDTYSLDDQLVLDDGLNTPFPLTGYTLRSHIRDASKALITTCTCTITNASLKIGDNNNGRVKTKKRR